MAILSKIRDRSIALIAVIGLALFAFVLDPSTLTEFFDSSKINEVGEVDGETISRQEYAEALDTYKTRSNNNISNMQAARTVWESILKDKIYEERTKLKIPDRKNRFVSTILGQEVNTYLVNNFKDVIMNYEFTSKLENDLEQIFNGKIIWISKSKGFFVVL